VGRRDLIDGYLSASPGALANGSVQLGLTKDRHADLGPSYDSDILQSWALTALVARSVRLAQTARATGVRTRCDH
jgi:hypothetical protein